MSRVTADKKICTRCNARLGYIYAIYKLNYYCIECYQEEIQERQRLINALPEVENKHPPLGWLHKFEEEDIDVLYKIMGELSLWEN